MLDTLLSPAMIKHYRKHPEQFLEEVLGVKLEYFQKELLKDLFSDEENEDD